MATTTIDFPAWLRPEDLSPSQMASVIRSGCAAGGYLPAVTYDAASAIMAQHGDDVLEFLEDYDSTPEVPAGISWSHLASLFLTKAVELFCSLHEEHADWHREDWN